MKVKTSISIDNEIWIELKNLALQRGKDISSILKDAIENELYLDLDKSLMKYSKYGKSDLDFEPIKPNSEISDLVRSMRDDRENRIS
jgi:predicted transcriptional regulator